MKKYFLFTIIVLTIACVKKSKAEDKSISLSCDDTVAYNINLDEFAKAKLKPFKKPLKFSYVVAVSLNNYDSTAIVLTIDINSGISDTAEFSQAQGSICDIPTAIRILAVLRESNTESTDIVIIVKEILTNRNWYEITEAVCFQKIYQNNGNFILSSLHRLK